MYCTRGDILIRGLGRGDGIGHGCSGGAAADLLGDRFTCSSARL
jgi:hypothetical protein